MPCSNWSPSVPVCIISFWSFDEFPSLYHTSQRTSRHLCLHLCFLLPNRALYSYKKALNSIAEACFHLIKQWGQHKNKNKTKKSWALSCSSHFNEGARVKMMSTFMSTDLTPLRNYNSSKLSSHEFKLARILFQPKLHWPGHSYSTACSHL